MKREEQQCGAWLQAVIEKLVRRIEVKVAGRSNVPWWGKQAYRASPASPVTHANADHGPERVNGSDLESEDNSGPLPYLRKSGKDLERDLREIEEALNHSPQNLEATNEARALNSAPINLESWDLNEKEVLNSVGGVVDKEIEELRNRVVLQDLLGNKEMEGNKSYSRKKKVGKENLPCNGNHNKMFEVNLQGESHVGWKRLPHEKDTATTDGVTLSLLGTKRVGSWPDLQTAGTNGKKKGKVAEAMEGVEVVGGSAEAVQQPRRTQ
ncbi:hypothetical protein FCV25MIE_07705 [Fagus crenata]